MKAVRRTYTYLVCAVSLQAIVWAAITLLRNLLVPFERASLVSTAQQIAIIVIGLPVFLGHWLWVERLARREADERGALLRRLYLYGSMAGFLAPAANNVLALIKALVDLTLRAAPGARPQILVRSAIAIAVLALLWLYHRRVLRSDTRTAPESGRAVAVRELYVYGFGATGLTMLTVAVVYLARWVLYQFGEPLAMYVGINIASEIARLAVGLALWLVHWNRAQRLGSRAEPRRPQIIRWLYLYLAVFVAVFGSVTGATIILADLLDRALGAHVIGFSANIRQGIALIAGLSWVWAYHALTLRQDSGRTLDLPSRATVRRLYLYVVAHVGLGALITGLGGNVSVLIRWLAGVRFAAGLAEEVAWFTAMTVSGLVVWILPWRRAQIASLSPGPAGNEERQSLIRRFYLYFYLFLATATVLSGGVYIVSQLVELALGVRGRAGLGSELGRALAFCLIAVVVWLYHGSLLRGDSRRLAQAQARRLETIRIAVLDADDGSLGQALVDGLRRELPGVSIQPLGLTPAAAEALGTDAEQVDVERVLATCDLIIGPWTIAVAGAARGAIRPLTARAVATSQARKLLVPVAEEGWDWAGIDVPSIEAISRDAVRAVRQTAAGQEVSRTQSLGAGAVAGIVLGVIIMLVLFGLPLIYLFAGSGPLG